MHRVDTSSNIAVIPAAQPAGTPGFFSSANPLAGQPATVPGADWFNTIQEELMAILVAAGISPSKTTNNQVLAAIEALVSEPASGLVHLAGAETITGKKTMSGGVTGLPAPAVSSDAVRKADTDAIYTALGMGGTNHTYGTVAAAEADGSLANGSFFNVAPGAGGAAVDIYLKNSSSSSTYIASTDSLARALAAEATITASFAPLTPLIGTMPVTYGVTPAAGSAFTGGINLLGQTVNGGPLVSISTYIGTLGSGALTLFRGTGSNPGSALTIIATYALTAAHANATNTFTASDFGSITLAAGEWIGLGYFSGGAQGNDSSIGGSAPGWYAVEASMPSGTITMNNLAGFGFGAEFVVNEPTANVTLPHLDAAVLNDLAGPVNSQIVYEADFGTSLPADWTTSGGTWTNPSGGLLPPASGAAFSQQAAMPHTNVALFVGRNLSHFLVFQPQATGNKFAFGGMADGFEYPTVAVVDDSAHQLSICSAQSSGIINTGGQVTLPALTAGRNYLAALTRNDRILTVTIFDLVTGATVATLTQGTNSSASSASNSQGYLCGSPFIANIVGQTLYQRYSVASPESAGHLATLGDSITHGDNIGLTRPQRWTDGVSANMRGGVSVYAMGGVTSDQINQLLQFELLNNKPKRILAYYGTNDVIQGLSLVTTQANFNALISFCSSNGIPLAVGIVPPMAGPATGYNYAPLIAWLLGLPASIRKVRFDLALSLGNDGATYDAANFGDGVHPNSTGMALMAGRCLADLPEWFYGLPYQYKLGML